MTSALTIVASNAIFSAALALVTLIVTRFWRSPQLAHGLWLLVLLKLITPPLVTVSPPVGWLDQRSVTVDASLPPTAARRTPSIISDDQVVYLPEPDLAMEPSAVASDSEFAQSPAEVILDDAPTPIRDSTGNRHAADASGEFAVTSSHLLAAVAIVWVAGAMAYLTILVRRCVSFQCVLAASTAAGADITEAVRRLAAKLGLTRSLRVRMVEATVPPLVWSLGRRPVVVLPSRLVAELSPAQRDALLAHELAHVLRRDDLVRWLEVIALVAFWWNPVAWLARRKLRKAEEECCDAWVVWALPAERKGYGQAMLATIEFLTDGPPLPALAGSNFGGAFYKRRIEMIMKRNVNRKISWAALGTIVLSAVAVLPIVGQTKSADEKQKGAQPDDPAVASSADASPASAPAADPLPEGAANETVAAPVDPTVSPRSDSPQNHSGAAANKTIEVPRNGNRSGSVNRANVSPGGQDASPEAIVERISRLEQLLQRIADEPGAINRIPRTGGSLRLSIRNTPADKQEQDLQEQLLKLDVEAAKADIEPARIKWERSKEANRKQPGTVSLLVVEHKHAELVQKEVQLQRAKILLELYQRQAQVGAMKPTAR